MPEKLPYNIGWIRKVPHPGADQELIALIEKLHKSLPNESNKEAYRCSLITEFYSKFQT
jgi:hypothetical protein